MEVLGDRFLDILDTFLPFLYAALAWIFCKEKKIPSLPIEAFWNGWTWETFENFGISFLRQDFILWCNVFAVFDLRFAWIWVNFRGCEISQTWNEFQAVTVLSGWWFQICLIFNPTWRNDRIWRAEHIFEMGWLQPPSLVLNMSGFFWASYWTKVKETTRVTLR